MLLLLLRFMREEILLLRWRMICRFGLGIGEKRTQKRGAGSEGLGMSYEERTFYLGLFTVYVLLWFLGDCFAGYSVSWLVRLGGIGTYGRVL